MLKSGFSGRLLANVTPVVLGDNSSKSGSGVFVRLQAESAATLAPRSSAAARPMMLSAVDECRMRNRVKKGARLMQPRCTTSSGLVPRSLYAVILATSVALLRSPRCAHVRMRFRQFSEHLSLIHISEPTRLG